MSSESQWPDSEPEAGESPGGPSHPYGAPVLSGPSAPPGPFGRLPDGADPTAADAAQADGARAEGAPADSAQAEGVDPDATEQRYVLPPISYASGPEAPVPAAGGRTPGGAAPAGAGGGSMFAPAPAFHPTSPDPAPVAQPSAERTDPAGVGDDDVIHPTDVFPAVSTQGFPRPADGGGGEDSAAAAPPPIPPVANGSPSGPYGAFGGPPVGGGTARPAQPGGGPRPDPAQQGLPSGPQPAARWQPDPTQPDPGGTTRLPAVPRGGPAFGAQRDAADAGGTPGDPAYLAAPVAGDDTTQVTAQPAFGGPGQFGHANGGQGTFGPATFGNAGPPPTGYGTSGPQQAGFGAGPPPVGYQNGGYYPGGTGQDGMGAYVPPGAPPIGGVPPASAKRPNRVLLIGGAAAAAVVLALGGFFGVRMATGDDSGTSQPDAGGQAATPVATSSPEKSKRGIDSWRTDRHKWTAHELFPHHKLRAAGLVFHEVRHQVSTCKKTVTKPMRRIVRTERCSAVVRATFVDSHKKFAVTAGIALFPNKLRADHAELWTRKVSGAHFTGLRGKKGSGAERITHAGGYSAHLAWGRYMAFSYATFANGQNPTKHSTGLKKVSSSLRWHAAAAIKRRAQRD